MIGTTPHRKPGRRRRGARRGAALVEYAITASLYFLLVFGIVELTWITIYRNALLNGAALAARDGAQSKPIATMQADVSSGSHLTVSTSYISIQYNSSDDASGSWSDVTDNASSTDPITGLPLANAVTTGKPIRVKVASYPYHLMTASFFSWLPGFSNGTIPLSVSAQQRRE